MKKLKSVRDWKNDIIIIIVFVWKFRLRVNVNCALT